MKRTMNPAIASATAPRFDQGLPLGLLVIGMSIILSCFGEDLALRTSGSVRQVAFPLVLPLAITLALMGAYWTRCLWLPANRAIAAATLSGAFIALAIGAGVGWNWMLQESHLWSVTWLVASQPWVVAACLVLAVVAMIPAVRLSSADVHEAQRAVERSVQHASDRLRAVSDRLQAVVPEATQSHA